MLRWKQDIQTKHDLWGLWWRSMIMTQVLSCGNAAQLMLKLHLLFLVSISFKSRLNIQLLLKWLYSVVSSYPTQSFCTTQKPAQEATGTDFHISPAVHVLFLQTTLPAGAPWCSHVCMFTCLPLIFAVFWLLPNGSGGERHAVRQTTGLCDT